MVCRIGIALFAAMLVSAPISHGADTTGISGIKLNPGERIIAINGVPVEKLGLKSDGTPINAGVVQASAVASSASTKPASPAIVDASYSSAAAPAVATNIVGNLVRSGMPFSHTPGESALEKANHERRRNGVGDLIPDPQLQELALQKATIAAGRRFKNHIGGSLGGARAEGVGHTQGRFLSCCLDMHATYGGAAMVQGADGWYCCLLVR